MGVRFTNKFSIVNLANTKKFQLTDDRWFEVDENGSRNVFSGPGFGEESVERIVAFAYRKVGRHQTVGSDSVLETILTFH